MLFSTCHVYDFFFPSSSKYYRISIFSDANFPTNRPSSPTLQGPASRLLAHNVIWASGFCFLVLLGIGTGRIELANDNLNYDMKLTIT